MKGLDRYLTNEPDSGFDGWSEDVIMEISDPFFWAYEKWLLESNLCSKWLGKLFDKGKSKKQAAAIIQRAHEFYKIIN